MEGCTGVVQPHFLWTHFVRREITYVYQVSPNLYSLYLEVVSTQPPHTILKKYIKQLAGSWVVGAGNISFVPGSGFWPSSTGKYLQYLEDHPS